MNQARGINVRVIEQSRFSNYYLRVTCECETRTGTHFLPERPQHWATPEPVNIHRATGINPSFLGNYPLYVRLGLGVKAPHSLSAPVPGAEAGLAGWTAPRTAGMNAEDLAKNPDKNRFCPTKITTTVIFSSFFSLVPIQF